MTYIKPKKGALKKRKKFTLTKTALKDIATQARKRRISKNAYLILCLQRLFEAEGEQNLFYTQGAGYDYKDIP